MSIIKRIKSRNVEVTQTLKGLHDVLEWTNSLEPSHETGDEYWRRWYKNYLQDSIKKYNVLRSIPYSKGGKFLINNIFMCDPYANAIKKILEDCYTSDTGVLRIKNIVLPAPINNNDAWAMAIVIVEVLLDYLLDVNDFDIFDSYEYRNVHLAEGDIVIGAGSCMGEFAALCSIKGCTTYAFEPTPHIIETYLSKTAQFNPRIEVCQFALSNKAGELVFTIDPTYILGASTFLLNKDKKARESFKAQAIDLDTFVEKNKLPKVDFIKADIEGAERYMLMGARQVLRKYAPKLALSTYHLPDDPQVLRELIIDSNPNYIIEEKWGKLYAYVPR